MTCSGEGLIHSRGRGGRSALAQTWCNAGEVPSLSTVEEDSLATPSPAGLCWNTLQGRGAPLRCPWWAPPRVRIVNGSDPTPFFLEIPFQATAGVAQVTQPPKEDDLRFKRSLVRGRGMLSCGVHDESCVGMNFQRKTGCNECPPERSTAGNVPRTRQSKPSLSWGDLEKAPRRERIAAQLKKKILRCTTISMISFSGMGSTSMVFTADATALPSCVPSSKKSCPCRGGECRRPTHRKPRR